MSERRTLGNLQTEAFGTLSLPQLPTGIVEGFADVSELTGMSLDAMDELGIIGVVPATILRPTVLNHLYLLTIWQQ